MRDFPVSMRVSGAVRPHLSFRFSLAFLVTLLLSMHCFSSSADALGGSITINQGAAVTNSTSVTLTMDAQLDPLVYCVLIFPIICGDGTMMFSNDGYSWSTAEQATTHKAWTLTPGYSTKTVYVLFRSATGMWVGPYSDTIEYADTPDPFSFTNQYNVPLNTVIYSNIVTVAGMIDPHPISIAGGEYSIDGGPFTSVAGTIANGSTVQLRQTSSSSLNTATQATLTIAGVSANFNVRTPYPDTTPDPFTFTPQYSVQLNTVVTSNSITVSGIQASAVIKISGGEYSVNGGAFTSSITSVNNGDTVVVRQTSSPSYSTATDATLTIGGVSSIFRVATMSNPSVTSVGYSPQWLIITLVSLTVAGGYRLKRRRFTA